MKSMLVFIDTSEFVKANFDFEGPAFKALTEYAQSGIIVLGVPEITKQEILRRIAAGVERADKGITKAASEARILRSARDEFGEILFREFNAKHYKDLLLSKFNEFLYDSKAMHISYEEANAAEVFEWYFSNQAPFGPKRKKSEFPDAFVLQALSNWGIREGKMVWVTSSDDDLKHGAERAENLGYAGTLNELLDTLSNEFDNLAASHARRALNSIVSQVKQDITSIFEYSGFLLSDQDGDVGSVKVQGLALDENLLGLRYLGEDMWLAVFDLSGDIDFSAELSYADPEATIYDKETGKAYAFSTIDRIVDRQEEIAATLEITFSIKNPAEASYSLVWNGPRDYMVEASEFDDWD